MKKLVLIVLVFNVLGVFASQPELTFPETWKQAEEPAEYVKEDLYLYMNGGSESFYIYNFESMKVRFLQKDNALLTVEVYDHKDEVNAYGKYISERPDAAVLKPYGLEGYNDGMNLNFSTGQYYVRMILVNSDTYEPLPNGAALLEDVQQHISSQLCSAPSMPKYYSIFPKEGQVEKSVCYTPDSYLGYEFMGAAYESKYLQGGVKYKVFFIERESKDQIKSMIKKYHEFAEVKTPRLKPGNFAFEDSFNGKINLHWVDNYMIGVVGDLDKKEISNIYSAIESNL